MTFAEGSTASGEEVSTELARSINLIDLFCQLEQDGTITIDTTNFQFIEYDGLTTDKMDAGSSHVQQNVTANLVALDVDNRDGTYTAAQAINMSVTFDATNDEEDFLDSGNTQSGSSYCRLTHKTSYRDGSVTIKLANWGATGGTAGNYTDTMRFTWAGITITRAQTSTTWATTASDGTNTFTVAATQWWRITRVAGRTKTEYSNNGTDWNTVTDYTDGATIGTASTPVIQIIGGAVGLSDGHTRSFSLQAWTVQGCYNSGYFLSDSVTASSNCKAVCATWINTDATGATATAITFSADDGSNYDTLTKGAFKSVGTTGTDMVFKCTLAYGTNENVSSQLHYYGYQWSEE